MFRVPSFCREWRTGRPPRLRIPAAQTQTPYCKKKVAAILFVKSQSPMQKIHLTAHDQN
jgi:hypothetical protein